MLVVAFAQARRTNIVRDHCRTIAAIGVGLLHNVCMQEHLVPRLRVAIIESDGVAAVIFAAMRAISRASLRRRTPPSVLLLCATASVETAKDRRSSRAHPPCLCGPLPCTSTTPLEVVRCCVGALRNISASAGGGDAQVAARKEACVSAQGVEAAMAAFGCAERRALRRLGRATTWLRAWRRWRCLLCSTCKGRSAIAS